jgi:beta-glucanase (GH16 family)
MSKFEKHIILVLMLLLSSTLIKAQIPFNDPAWIRQDAAHGTDEFNTAIDNSMWYKCYPWNCGTYSIFDGAELNYPANVIWNTGDTTVTIKADTIQPSITWVRVTPSGNNLIPANGVDYAYTGGVLWRKQVNDTDIYKFGYIEILAKYPSGVWPLWPAFWLYGQGDCDDMIYINDYYDEIDIAENWPSVTADGYKVGTNAWFSNPGSCNRDFNIGGEENSTGFLVSSGFHKYACEWGPDRIIWYVDDAPVRFLYDPTGATVATYRMTLILGMGLAKDLAYLPSNWTAVSNTPQEPTNWPQYYEIAYLRYYKLNLDCSTDLTLSSTSYDRKVKKTITTSASSTLNFNPSSPSASYTLRATDAVTINAPTGSNSVTINPSSTGYFAIQVMDCPN